MNERRILDALFGVYAAVLLVPTGVLVGWDAGAAELPVTAFIGIGVGIAVVVTLGTRTVDNLVDRVVSLPVVPVIVGLPLLYLPYLIVVAEPGSLRGIIGAIGLLALLPGIGVLASGAIIRNRRLRETSTEIAVVTVGDTGDKNWRQLQIAALAVGAIALITAGAITAITGDASFSTLLTSVSGLSTVFLLFNNGKELAVTDVGFRVEQSVVVWDDLAGYRLTDEKVVLVRSEWYLPARRFDREEISDEDALIKGLEKFLPRLDKHGRVELAARK